MWIWTAVWYAALPLPYLSSFQNVTWKPHKPAEFRRTATVWNDLSQDKLYNTITRLSWMSFDFSVQVPQLAIEDRMSKAAEYSANRNSVIFSSRGGCSVQVNEFFEFEKEIFKCIFFSNILISTRIILRGLQTVLNLQLLRKKLKASLGYALFFRPSSKGSVGKTWKVFYFTSRSNFLNRHQNGKQVITWAGKERANLNFPRLYLELNTIV